MKKAIVLSMLMFAVYACKETGDVGNAGGAGGAVQDISVKGTVLHSAFSATDKVCFDRDKSKSCDEGEPSVLIATDGKYEIKGKASDTFAPLIAELSNTTTGTLSDASVTPLIAELSNTTGTPKLVFETPSGQSTISSITTLIKLKMDVATASLTTAENYVKRELGITGVSLFEPAPADNVNAFAKTISETMTAMFDKLTTLGIATDKTLTFFVLDGISASLFDIQSGKTADQIATKTIGNKDKTAIEGEIKSLVDKMGSVTIQSATDAFNAGLTIYGFHSGNSAKTRYIFELMEFSASHMRMKADIPPTNPPTGDYMDPLPTIAEGDPTAPLTLNSDGSATLDGGNRDITFTTVETIKLDNKSLTSHHPFGSKKINFSAGAIMYKFNQIYTQATLDLELLRNDVKPNRTGKYCYNDGIFMCESGQFVSNNQFTAWYHNIMMDDTTNTYYVEALNNEEYYSVFGPVMTMSKGTYIKTKDNFGDLYEFKNDNGIVVMKIYALSSPSEYYMAGYFHDFKQLELEYIYFNTIAAKDLQNQWDPNK